MMEEYLGAECVFNALFEKDVLTKQDWKMKSNQSLYYNASFFYTKRKSLRSFVVYVKNSRHCIEKLSLENQAHVLQIPIDDILLHCAITET
jgi:hypothetical protein